MKFTRSHMRWHVLTFFFAAVFSLLAFSRDTYAGDIDFHIGIAVPFPGYVVGPPVVGYPAPHLDGYDRPIVVVQPRYKYYSPYNYRHGYHSWEDREYYGDARHHRDHDEDDDD